MAERTAVLEWCVAGRPITGEERSGDDALVLSRDDGALVAAVDGVGHGPEAAHAADIAIAAVRDGCSDDVVELAQRCHESLRPTRGAALGLAAFRSAGTMTWLAVGNVTGRLLRGGRVASGGEWLPSLSGLPGDELPALRPATVPLRRGDVLIVTTDGIDPAYADEAVATGTCDEIADGVLRDHARVADDALVVVARYLGESAP
jgi:phosphoserine phosphatase RsbX